ncbi:MAG: Chemotaxis protein methyltransferase CheR, partial [uncultured Chloroflexia bacterium]
MTNHDRSPGALSDAQPDQAQHVHAPENSPQLEALIRSFDWSTTSLGSIEQWPQSLKTSVDIMVQSPVPMVTLWGPDGIMIYNDGYALIADNKHPSILGSKVLDAWPEAADFNRHVLEVVLGGKALTYRDQYLVLNRERGPEDVWLDINYSPVLDETGRPAGVMAIVVETTARVLEERKRRETEERYQLALEATGMIGVCELDLTTDTVYADARFAAMFGVGAERTAQGASADEYLRRIHPDDVDNVVQG